MREHRECSTSMIFSLQNKVEELCVSVIKWGTRKIFFKHCKDNNPTSKVVLNWSN